MMAPAHMLSGAVAWLGGCAAAAVVGVHPSPTAVIAGAAVGTIGALLPDFDHPKSMASMALWPITKPMSYGTRLLSKAVYRATSTDADRRERCEGTHRCLSHTWPWAVFLGLFATGALRVAGLHWTWMATWWWLGMPLAVGCLAHTLGDAMTHSGVPLLWPFVSQGRRWRRVGPRFFRTNSWVEHGPVTVALVLLGAFALWRLAPGMIADLPHVAAK